jgi:CheY-like chemotaxis protein
LSDRPYDVILVDADLPGGGGIESVKSFGPAVDRDTVALIAPFLKWDAVEEEANRAGIYRFLAKPIFPSSVWGVIDGLRRMEDGVDDVCGMDVSDAANSAPDLSGKRILLTDDVDINRVIVIELLSGTNADIEEAESGAETLSMFEASPENYYNLVLMDIQMPGMDGYETTQRLRELPRPDAKTVPIIALTANAYKEDAERALASGMDGYLAKPIDIGKVFDVLAKYLKEERK